MKNKAYLICSEVSEEELTNCLEGWNYGIRKITRISNYAPDDIVFLVDSAYQNAKEDELREMGKCVAENIFGSVVIGIFPKSGAQYPVLIHNDIKVEKTLIEETREMCEGLTGIDEVIFIDHFISNGDEDEIPVRNFEIFPLAAVYPEKFAEEMKQLQEIYPAIQYREYEIIDLSL